MIESLEKTPTPPGSAAERIVVAVPPGLPRQLVVDYLGRCRENARAVQAALARGDFGQAGVLGHRMKGSGCSYGFAEVTATGAAIEQAAQRQAAEDVGVAVGRLEAYLRAVQLEGG